MSRIMINPIRQKQCIDMGLVPRHFSIRRPAVKPIGFLLIVAFIVLLAAIAYCGIDCGPAAVPSIAG